LQAPQDSFHLQILFICSSNDPEQMRRGERASTCNSSSESTVMGDAFIATEIFD
jgi:hypothetical protein